MTKRFDANFLFLCQLELENRSWDTQEQGASLLTGQRAAALFGMAPKDSVDIAKNPPEIDPKIFDIAKKSRIPYYVRLKDEYQVCWTAIDHFAPIMISLRIGPQWYANNNGVIQFPENADELSENHAVLITGYDLKQGYFIFRNSWGIKWGDEGYGMLPFGYFDAHGLDAYCSPLSIDKQTSELDGDFRIYRSEITTPGNSIMNAIYIKSKATDEPLAWTFYDTPPRYVTAWEFFVAPEYRRQGVGRFMLDQLKRIASQSHAELAVRVSDIDCALLSPGLPDLAYSLGMKIMEAPYRFAPRLLVAK